MVRTWVADAEDGLQIWRTAANILNSESQAADKGWCLSLLRNVTKGLGLGLAFVNKVMILRFQ
jgi:hypothetical protein